MSETRPSVATITGRDTPPKIAAVRPVTHPTGPTTEPLIGEGSGLSIEVNPEHPVHTTETRGELPVTDADPIGTRLTERYHRESILWRTGPDPRLNWQPPTTNAPLSKEEEAIASHPTENLDAIAAIITDYDPHAVHYHDATGDTEAIPVVVAPKEEIKVPPATQTYYNNDIIPVPRIYLNSSHNHQYYRDMITNNPSMMSPYLQMTYAYFNEARRLAIVLQETQRGDITHAAEQLGMDRAIRTAVSACEQGLKNAGKHPELFVAKAAIEIWMGQFQEARKDLRDAVRRAPEVVDYNVFLAEVNEQLGREQEAHRNYNTAIRLNPENETLYIKKGLLFEHARRWQEAQALYGRALFFNPESTDILTAIRNVHMIQGNTASAEIINNQIRTLQQEQNPLNYGIEAPHNSRTVLGHEQRSPSLERENATLQYEDKTTIEKTAMDARVLINRQFEFYKRGELQSPPSIQEQLYIIALSLHRLTDGMPIQDYDAHRNRLFGEVVLRIFPEVQTELVNVSMLESWDSDKIVHYTASLLKLPNSNAEYISLANLPPYQELEKDQPLPYTDTLWEELHTTNPPGPFRIAARKLLAIAYKTGTEFEAYEPDKTDDTAVEAIVKTSKAYYAKMQARVTEMSPAFKEFFTTTFVPVVETVQETMRYSKASAVQTTGEIQNFIQATAIPTTRNFIEQKFIPAAKQAYQTAEQTRKEVIVPAIQKFKTETAPIIASRTLSYMDTAAHSLIENTLPRLENLLEESGIPLEISESAAELYEKFKLFQQQFYNIEMIALQRIAETDPQKALIYQKDLIARVEEDESLLENPIRDELLFHLYADRIDWVTQVSPEKVSRLIEFYKQALRYRPGERLALANTCVDLIARGYVKEAQELREYFEKRGYFKQNVSHQMTGNPSLVGIS